MSKKKESMDTYKFLSALQSLGWFRNITDYFQIGVPDILGTYRGFFYGLEIKSVEFIPEDGLAPLKKDHCFTKKQVEELKSINKSDGIGLGLIICGPHLYYGGPEYINKHGQMNCNELLKRDNYIKKVSNKWDLKHFLEKAQHGHNGKRNHQRKT